MALLVLPTPVDAQATMTLDDCAQLTLANNHALHAQ
jgi:hypothetical protein